MRSSVLKVSVVVFGAAFALSTVAAGAIPMGPIPTGGKGKLVASIPMGPIPTGGKGKLVAAIPMGPIPTGGKGKLVA